MGRILKMQKPDCMVAAPGHEIRKGLSLSEASRLASALSEDPDSFGLAHVLSFQDETRFQHEYVEGELRTIRRLNPPPKDAPTFLSPYGMPQIDPEAEFVDPGLGTEIIGLLKGKHPDDSVGPQVLIYGNPLFISEPTLFSDLMENEVETFNDERYIRMLKSMAYWKPDAAYNNKNIRYRHYLFLAQDPSILLGILDGERTFAQVSENEFTYRHQMVHAYVAPNEERSFVESYLQAQVNKIQTADLDNLKNTLPEKSYLTAELPKLNLIAEYSD